MSLSPSLALRLPPTNLFWSLLKSKHPLLRPSNLLLSPCRSRNLYLPPPNLFLSPPELRHLPSNLFRSPPQSRNLSLLPDLPHRQSLLRPRAPSPLMQLSQFPRPPLNPSLKRLLPSNLTHRRRPHPQLRLPLLALMVIPSLQARGVPPLLRRLCPQRLSGRHRVSFRSPHGTRRHSLLGKLKELFSDKDKERKEKA
ncbi:hypothetical protein BGW80DRAFT_678444 [Lactifluus volemus]|nr:hypothetical protein BGW80DRAFT_678444 [Lactifluus volemus]